jgi:5-methylthioadenosine/S-adenosylhomocysteine deaminase
MRCDDQGEGAMSKYGKPHGTHPGMVRRDFLKATGAVVAASALSGAAPEALAASASGRTLLKGGCVLTFDQAVGDFEKADVLIEGKRIAAVGRNLAAANANVIDATGTIVIPGFIDTHHHLYQALLRNVQGNGLLADYFRDIANGPKSATPFFRPQDAYIGGLSGALRSLDSGVTTIADVSQVNNSPEHSDELIRGFQQSGARIVFAYTSGAGPDVKWPQDLERLLKRYFSSSDQLVTPAFSGSVNRDVFATGRKYGMRIWSHIVGTLPNSFPKDFEQMAAEGVLRSDNVYIHFTGATSKQVKLVADTGGAVSAAVPIEMTMRHGMPIVQLCLDNGLTPSLSSDVETSMSADMFTMMRACFLLQRAMLNERSIQGEKDLPKLLTARDVIAMATVQGARDCGLDKKIGTLTPGKDADIVMLRADTIDSFPLNNAYGAIVTGMDTSNVDTVIVAGKIAKRHGRLVGVDLARIRKQATQARDYIAGKMNWPSSVIDTSLPGR